MRAAAVAILAISQLTLVPFVSGLSKNATMGHVAVVERSALDPNVTVIYRREGLGIVVESHSTEQHDFQPAQKLAI